MCNEDSVGSGQGEAEGAGVDKVLGESSDLAPGVGCDTSLVDTTGLNANMTSERMEEMKLVRPTIRRADCRWASRIG